MAQSVHCDTVTVVESTKARHPPGLATQIPVLVAILPLVPCLLGSNSGLFGSISLTCTDVDATVPGRGVIGCSRTMPGEAPKLALPSDEQLGLSQLKGRPRLRSLAMHPLEGGP